MLAVQLHPFGPSVLVNLEPIGKLYPRAALHLRILRDATNVAKGDRFERIVRPARAEAQPVLGSLELHFQVPAPDDARIDDPESAVGHGLRKALSPGPGAAQYAGSVERKLGIIERAVRLNHAGERLAIAPRCN